MDKRIIKIIFALISCILIVIGVYLAYNVFYPEIYYQKNLKNNFTPPPMTEIVSTGSESTPTPNQENFPDRLIIPKIGVDMELGTDPKTLDTAGWVQNLYPDNSPMVVAAHRFGWVGMPLDKRVTHTLFNVDKLEIGDEVVVQWNGERKIYKIKDITEATNNPSIKEGEVLIYTCKFLNSNTRVFVSLGTL